MKLQPDKSDVQTLTAHGPGWVAINNERVEASVVVGSRGERFDWNCSRFEAARRRAFRAVGRPGRRN